MLIHVMISNFKMQYKWLASDFHSPVLHVYLHHRLMTLVVNSTKTPTTVIWKIFAVKKFHCHQGLQKLNTWNIFNTHGKSLNACYIFVVYPGLQKFLTQKFYAQSVFNKIFLNYGIDERKTADKEKETEIKRAQPFSHKTLLRSSALSSMHDFSTPKHLIFKWHLYPSSKWLERQVINQNMRSVFPLNEQALVRI